MVRPRPITAMVRVAGAVLHATGKVVVQIEQRGGAPLLFREMKGLLRVFQKDVRMRLPGVEVEESEVKRRLC